MPDRHTRDLNVLDKFVHVYCRGRHSSEATEAGLCPACADLLAYAGSRLERCPHDPKPSCRKCTTHCYAGEYRARIREVMKYSGMHFVKRGRVDWLIRHFL